jgi:1,4-dihydroxy-6-naphthoate synthase
LLLRLFLPDHRQTVIMRFDQILDAVASGQVDAGVIIHESRFTYHEHGLRCVQDLGAWWEQTAGLPLPLGCIAVRKSLGEETAAELEDALAASIRWAQANPAACLPYIRRHAQEMDEAVLASHIGLYVNHFTLSLGDEGREAVRELLRRSRAAGIFA